MFVSCACVCVCDGGGHAHTEILFLIWRISLSFITYSGNCVCVCVCMCVTEFGILSEGTKDVNLIKISVIMCWSRISDLILPADIVLSASTFFPFNNTNVSFPVAYI